MHQNILITLASIAYLTTLGAFLFLINIKPKVDHGLTRYNNLLSLALGWAAVTLHAWLLARDLFANSDINLSLGTVFSLVTLITVLVFLLASVTRDVANLGLFVMPVGLCGLLVGVFLAGEPVPWENSTPLQWWHLGIALLAFGFLCIAAAQATLLYFQHKHLHRHHPGSLLSSLPPIQTMENNLFWLTLIGVILLTLNLIVGMIYLHHQEGKALEFNHHILLSFVAWLGFAGLLSGHWLYGWRGTVAVRWTLAAFSILILAYFGSQFVTTIILT